MKREQICQFRATWRVVIILAWTCAMFALAWSAATWYGCTPQAELRVRSAFVRGWPVRRCAWAVPVPSPAARRGMAVTVSNHLAPSTAY